MLKVNKSEFLTNRRAKLWVFDAATLFLSLIGVEILFCHAERSRSAKKD